MIKSLCALYASHSTIVYKNKILERYGKKAFRRNISSKPMQGQIKPTPCLLFTLKSIKNCHTEMNDVTVFLSVNKRFDLLAQKHGDYHLRTVKRNVGNNSRKKSLLEVHACLISEPK